MNGSPLLLKVDNSLLSGLLQFHKQIFRLHLLFLLMLRVTWLQPVEYLISSGDWSGTGLFDSAHDTVLLN